MTEQPVQPVQSEDATLKQIAEHLQAIRSRLNFFAFVLVMYIALSILNFVLTI